MTLVLGCGGGGGSQTFREPLAASADWNAEVDDRVAAIGQAWERVERGEADREITRESLRSLAWDLDTPEPVRAAALEAILWDEENESDSATLVSEMAPTEPGRYAMAVLATAAADHRWEGTTAAFVRSLARPVKRVKLSERAEYQALVRIHPDRELAGVVLGVFLDPETDPGPGSLRLDMRAREGAWELLSQLTPDDAARGRLLDQVSAPDAESAEILGDLRALRDELRVVPETGEEMRWGLRLARGRAGEHAGWWSETTRAVRGMPAGTGLELRHLEAVRLAAATDASLLRADREALVSLLGERLRGRRTYVRQKSVRGTVTAGDERLDRVRDELSWGDALVLLLLDEMLADPGVRAELFTAADADHADRATEHGGLLRVSGGTPLVQRFAPRGASTGDDRRFVAPREMIEYSDTALAHIHFHVTSWRNRDYAGPSPADLDYASRFGRACVVLSGLGDDTLNADAYLPGDLILDLGTVRRSSADR